MPNIIISFFVSFLYQAFVRADYNIDDSNYSILKFSENPSGPVWGPFGSDTGEVLELRLPNGTMQTIDATRCYNGTYTYAACTASDDCSVQWSFTGSGVTIYVLQAGPQGMSASLSIDSGTATTATLAAPSSPQYYMPQVVLFDVQGIPSGTHSAVMTVLDWDGNFSGMMLDYINVNQAEVASPTTSSSPASSPSPSPTPSSSPTTSTAQSTSPSSGVASSQSTSSTGTQTSATAPSIISVLSSRTSTTVPSSTASGNGTTSPNTLSEASTKSHVAAIAGGVVGGVVGLLALLFLAFCVYRRLRRRQQLRTLSLPSAFPQQPEARFTSYTEADPFASSVTLSASRPSGTSRPLQSWTASDAGSTGTPNFGARDQSSLSAVARVSHTRVGSSGDNSITSSVPMSLGVVAAQQDQDVSRPAPAAGYPNEKAQPAPSARPQDLNVTSARSDAVLTDEQADFVNSLFNNNVPAPVVARVLERMLANPSGASTTGANDPELRAWRVGSGTMSMYGDGETTVGSTAPPSYYHGQE